MVSLFDAGIVFAVGDGCSGITPFGGPMAGLWPSAVIGLMMLCSIALRAGSHWVENGQTNRFTKASAVIATSSQPLSMVRECPRPGISVISVTPSFLLWCL